jgi:hypothetical protein
MAALSEKSNLFLSKEGFLDKLSRGKGLSAILGANWKKRKFRLVGQRLSYYKIIASGEHVKKGELDMANVVVGSATGAKVDSQTDFWAFMIHTSDGDEMTMKASSQEEKDEWIAMLNKASKSPLIPIEDSNEDTTLATTERTGSSEQGAGGEKAV